MVQVFNTPGEVVNGIEPVAYPEANPDKDDSEEGVYKGTIAGSSGVFKVNLNNNDDGIYKVYIRFDGTDYVWLLSHSNPYSYSGPDGEFEIYVNATGVIQYVTFELTAHTEPIAIKGVKETSAEVVKVYEGTAEFAGNPVLLTWNLTVCGDDLSVAYCFKYVSQSDNDIMEQVTATAVKNPVTGLVSGEAGTIAMWYRETGTSDPYVLANMPVSYPVDFPDVSHFDPEHGPQSEFPEEIVITNLNDSSISGTWEQDDFRGQYSGTFSGTRVQ